MIYLDNAATTFPKPPSVTEETLRALTHYGGNPGRGAHILSLSAAQKVFDCRCALAELLGVSDPSRILFTLNTTYALNHAIKGLLSEGDHVLISDMEHNAVWRPVEKLAAMGQITYDLFPTLTADDRQTPTRICAAIAKRVRPNTRLVVCCHASNVCSAALPLLSIANFCQKRGIRLVVDAAQSAGHLPISVDAMGISVLCAPSHKGLYGPQGCGILALGRDVPMDTLIEGGNGVQSLQPFMPEDPPERYEAGTLPTPAIAGLLRGVETVMAMGTDAIDSHAKRLYACYRDRLLSLPDICIHAPTYCGSVLSFTHPRFPSESICRSLSEKGICVRGGHHCAALAHKTLQTPADGAVRISFGIFNTVAEADTFYRALREILQE